MTTPTDRKLHYWLLLKPDLSSPSGGIKQAHRLAEALGMLNRKATLLQQRSTFHPGWFESKVCTISEADWRQRQDLSPQKDIVIMPETYSGEFLSYAPELPKIIFNQNAAYSFGLPTSSTMHRPSSLISLYKHPSIRHILCVSEHDRSLISSGFQAGEERVSRIRNAIETDIFKPAGRKKKQLCYMPRKNPRDSVIVLEMLQRCAWFQSWSVVPITQQPQAKVAEIMRTSLIFLSFGHPEGFGLPVAEAMASGCYVVGYSGLGGRELYALGQQWSTCQEIAVGDWLGYVSAVERINQALQADSTTQIKRLIGCSQATRQHYSQQEMLKSLEAALQIIEGPAI